MGILKYVENPPENLDEVPYGVAFRINGDFFVNIPDELIEAK